MSRVPIPILSLACLRSAFYNYSLHFDLLSLHNLGMTVINTLFSQEIVPARSPIILYSKDSR